MAKLTPSGGLLNSLPDLYLGNNGLLGSQKANGLLAPSPVNPLNKLYGYEVRSPYAGENAYFKSNPSVAGMAAQDNKITLNPYSKNSPSEQRAVAKNEAVRLWLNQNGVNPDFKLTPEQMSTFSGTEYGKPENVSHLRNTILARAIAGDPSVGKLTPEQEQWVAAIKAKLPRQ